MADTFVVTRSQSMNASPEKVFAKIVDLREWEAWSPWMALDPNMEKSFSGDPGTVGASYRWSGNRKVGEGRMQTASIDAPNRVAIDLEFLKPFKSTNLTELSIEPDGDGSNVTWTMTGPKTLMVKIMSVFRSMDATVGPDFEKGLASLKAIVES